MEGVFTDLLRSNEPGEGCVYVTRGTAKVTWYSPNPGAVWRHRGMSRSNRITGDIPLLLRDVIASARKSFLPAGA
jgi:hypothetical protein